MWGRALRDDTRTAVEQTTFHSYSPLYDPTLIQWVTYRFLMLAHVMAVMTVAMSAAHKPTIIVI